MDYSRAGVKNAAKASLRGRRPSPRMVTLVFLALTLLPSLILSLVQGLYLSFLVMEANYLYPYHIHAQIQGSRWIFAFLYLLCYLFSLIFQTGFIGYGMDLYRRRETGYAALFAPLSQVGRVLLLSLLVLVFTFLWTLGLTLIYALLVSLFPYQLREAASVLLTIPLLILLLARLLRYALAYNVLVDRPELTARQCLNESKALMRGRRWSLFVLILSFLGWGLLASAVFLAVFYLSMFAAVALSGLIYLNYAMVLICTGLSFLLGLLCAAPLLLWLLPYMSAAVAGFYDCAVGRPGPRAQEPPSTGGQPYSMREPPLRSPGEPWEPGTYGPDAPPRPPRRDREDPWDR